MHLYLSFKSTTCLCCSFTMSVFKHVSVSCCMSGNWDRSGWKWHSGFEHEKEPKPRQSYASHFFQYSTSHSFLFSFQNKQHFGKCSLLPGSLWARRLGHTNQLQQDTWQERRKGGIFFQFLSDFFPMGEWSDNGISINLCQWALDLTCKSIGSESHLRA